MSERVSEALLGKLSEFVASRLGLHFPRERWHDLERGALVASRESGFEDEVNRFLRELLFALNKNQNKSQMEALVSHLTVGETYFFRERRSLEALEQRIVPELIHLRGDRDRELKIWSAGCATGEEPYSIAIMLRGMLPALADWKITITATDVNTRALRRAGEGLYTGWSFRDTPEWIRSRYFQATSDRRWAIATSIKSMVTLAYLNLVEEDGTSFLNGTDEVDIIFCRNVLMYLTPDARKRVIGRFHRSLARDGWLIVGPAETSPSLYSGFASISVPEATLYRRAETELQVVVPSFSCAEEEEQPRIRLPLVVAPHEGNSRHLAIAESRPAPLSVQAPELHVWGSDEEAAVQRNVAHPCNGAVDAQALLLLARSDANQGKLTAALAWCEKAIESDKTAACAHYLHAMILQEQGSLAEAIRSLRRTVYLDPRFVLGHFALGSLALRGDRPKESERHFDNVLVLLASYGPDEVVPESEGLSAGRLRELVTVQSRQSALADRGW